MVVRGGVEEVGVMRGNIDKRREYQRSIGLRRSLSISDPLYLPFLIPQHSFPPSSINHFLTLVAAFKLGSASQKSFILAIKSEGNVPSAVQID